MERRCGDRCVAAGKILFLQSCFPWYAFLTEQIKAIVSYRHLRQTSGELDQFLLKGIVPSIMQILLFFQMYDFLESNY